MTLVGDRQTRRHPRARHTGLILRGDGWLLRWSVAARSLQLADVVAEEVVDGDELVKVAVRVEQELQGRQRPSVHSAKPRAVCLEQGLLHQMDTVHGSDVRRWRIGPTSGGRERRGQCREWLSRWGVC